MSLPIYEVATLELTNLELAMILASMYKLATYDDLSPLLMDLGDKICDYLEDLLNNNPVDNSDIQE